MSLTPVSPEQRLGMQNEKTVDSDLFLDEELLKCVFQDPDTVKKNYEAMFGQIRVDTGMQNQDITKIYVQRIDVTREKNAISYSVQYDDNTIKSFTIGAVYDHSSVMGEVTTLGILGQISEIQEGGGKWNVYNDLTSFFYGFLLGWREKLKKLGIKLDQEYTPPISLINADVSPRVSIISKNGDHKTIVTERRPRFDEGEMGEVSREHENITIETNAKITDVLRNGKNTFKSRPGQKTHTLLGVLYKRKLGTDIQEHARHYLEQVLLSSFTLSFNSELPELGGILQAIIDSQILRTNSTKAVSETLKNLQLHLLECTIFTQREKADTAFLDMTHESSQEHEILLGTVENRRDYKSGNSMVGNGRNSFIERRHASAKEHFLATEIKRNELVCASIEHIVLAISTLNEIHNRTTYCGILITSGPFGMAGVCSMFDFRVISSSKVIEGSSDEEKLIESVRSKMGSQKFIDKENKDTTGCGDISMAAWLSGKFEIGQQLRESEYYRIFKIIGKQNDISAEQYRRAIAITEAYWRMAFTRVMSGLMFRTKAPNMSFISPDAMETSILFVSSEVAKFMLNELADFVHGSKHISDSGFFHLHAIDKLNRGGKGSLEILCEREGISAEDIVMRQGELLKKGIPSKDEALRRAKAQLLHEKWGWKTPPKDV